MNILIINGPNLNLLGKREVSIYGEETLASIIAHTEMNIAKFQSLTWFQSNIEGEIVDKIQELVTTDNYDALIINPGAYSHTSVAIHDALKITDRPKVEVHLSQIYQREEFRHTLLTARACTTIINGLGREVYHTACYALKSIFNKE
jgi:3-dehydroquinate dehydratase II